MNNKPLEVKFREIMRRLNTRRWSIRFWFTLTGGFSPASAYSAVLEFKRTYSAECDALTDPHGVEPLILYAFKSTPLAAFEVVDFEGDGMVTYTDW